MSLQESQIGQSEVQASGFFQPDKEMTDFLNKCFNDYSLKERFSNWNYGPYLIRGEDGIEVLKYRDRCQQALEMYMEYLNFFY